MWLFESSCRKDFRQRSIGALRPALVPPRHTRRARDRDLIGQDIKWLGAQLRLEPGPACRTRLTPIPVSNLCPAATRE